MSTEKSLTLELTAKEYRQLIFLAHLGAFIYQTTRKMNDPGLNAGYAMLNKLGMQGKQAGEKVLGADNRLVESIDMAVVKEVIAHNRDVMEKEEFWRQFEKLALS